MTQGEALTILKTGANVYLTGEPGTGKTHTVNAFTSWLRACGIESSITAATGIAATHIGGMTIHSWSGIGITNDFSPVEIDRIASKEHLSKRINKAKVLIIDEISMLSASTFEAVDAVCKEVRRSEKPFGGLTVILVGDFFQLPPVSRGKEQKFAYESETWRALNPLVCYLTEQHRQDDHEFLEVLSGIRSGEVEELHYERLMERNSKENIPVAIPKLYSHNADVDRMNAEELSKLKGSVRRFLMESSGKDSLVEGLKRGCLSPETLELKIGAAVMFTKNAPLGKFVNGTLGTVVEFDGEGLPVVRAQNDELITAEPMEWQVQEEGKVRASIKQVPLRLAYAMTVHKSQGMSMDAAVMDLSRAFEYGQGYVALSRVRRLSGLYLLGFNARALEVHPAIREKDGDLRRASEVAQEAFAEIHEEEKVQLQKNFVKALGGAWMEENNFSATENLQKNSLPGRLAETLRVMREEKTLQAAAKARGLTESTLVKHLEELEGRGLLRRTDFEHLLPPISARDEIYEAFKTVPGERLAPVFHALGGRYSFEVIRLARLAQK